MGTTWGRSFSLTPARLASRSNSKRSGGGAAMSGSRLKRLSKGQSKGVVGVEDMVAADEEEERRGRVTADKRLRSRTTSARNRCTNKTKHSPPRGSNSQPSDHMRKSLTLYPIELGGPCATGHNESLYSVQPRHISHPNPCRQVSDRVRREGGGAHVPMHNLFLFPDSRSSVIAHRTVCSQLTWPEKRITSRFSSMNSVLSSAWFEYPCCVTNSRTRL